MTKNLITLSLLLSLGACDLLEDDDTPEEVVAQNTAATFAGDSTGSLSTDASAAISGTLDITDPDADEAAVTAQTDVATSYGSFTIATDGSWSYTLDTTNTDVAGLASASDTLTDTITVVSVDETETTIVITISGVDPVNTAATFGGDLTNTVSNDASAAITGAITVTDSDSGEDAVTAQTDAATTYGSFTIATDGAWSYTLDATNTDVAGLASSSDTLTDTISIESVDGTMTDLVITISGVDSSTGSASCTTAAELTATGAIASHYDGSKVPGNVLDDDLDSTWAGNAFRDVDGVTQDNVTITVKVDDIAVISQLGLIWDKGDERTTSYKVETSKDNSTWTEVLATTDSLQQSGAEGVEDVALTPSIAEYVRITGYGNNGGSGWTSVNDLTISGCDTDEASVATNTAATIVGTVDADIDNDETTVVGALTVLDLDGDTLVATGDTADQGTYGTFSIDADGQWTYTLDTTHSSVAALAEGETLAEQDFTVAATDASEATIAITIVGAAPAVVITDDTNFAAQILDTDTGDTGELRIDVNDLASGTLTTRVQLQPDEDTTILDTASSIKSTGYITLGDGSSEVAELILSSGTVKYRDSNDDQQTIADLTYTEGDVLDVVIDWDASGYSLSIDGGTTTYGPYVGSAAVDGVNPVVNRLSFRLADSTAQSQHEFNVDQIVIAEDSLSESFSQDDYSINDDLVDGAAAPFNDDGSEATVQPVDFAESDSGSGSGSDTPNTKMATIVDVIGEDSDPVGEEAGVLRYKRDYSDALEQGKVTVSVRNNSTDQDAFFMLYGSSTSTSDAILDLRIKKNGGGFEIRGDDDDDAADFTAVPVGDWMDIAVTWDSSSDTDFSTITLTINDESRTFTSFTGFSDSDISDDDTAAGRTTIQQIDYVRTVNFKLASDDGISDGSYDVDDLKVYSDTAGTTAVFDVDFEDDLYVVGDDLEADTDPSPFDGSTIQATVAARP